MIGKIVKVVVDRPLGTYHPKHKDIFYTVNYGYVEGVMAPDGEEQDVYILGVDKPVKEFEGRIIAIIHRYDDVEEKWVVAPENVSFTREEIMEKVAFQEKYFQSEVRMAEKEQYMDNYIDERDYQLLEGDKYTFFVLRRIMDKSCKVLLSDHERCIICFSTEPYPTWIWTAEDITQAEMENVYELLVRNNLMDGKHTFNVKYELAEYLIKRAKQNGIDLKIQTNMFAYDCPQPIAPSEMAEGEIYKCEEKDREELAEFAEMFHDETGVGRMDKEGYLKYAEEKIADGRTFFWKDAQGNHVASCTYDRNGDMASVGLVYTRPEYRRKHYGENLVYQVTKIVEAQGCVPMLYTDADYVASNACYEKIGYIFRGKLCMVG